MSARTLARSVEAQTGDKHANGPRRLDIQGLRAVAVILVVLFHAGANLPGGFIGVDVFFVISGFVITAMLCRELDKRGRINLGRFYLRRFKRLTPALALMVSFTALASILILSPLGPQQNTAYTGIGAILLGANFVIQRTTGGYFDTSAEMNPLLHTWSLSVEEQFYLIFPLFLIASAWALGKRLGSLRGLAAGVVMLGLVSLLLAIFGAHGPSGSLALLPESLAGFYGPATRAWEFAAGALLSLGLRSWPDIPGQVAVGSGLLGLVMLVASLGLISDATPFPSIWTLLPVSATILLLGAGSSEPNIISRSLSTPLLVRIGDWSYSLYLWHWPFIVFASMIWTEDRLTLTIAALLSVLPAYASYRWLEEPIRSMRLPSRAHVGRLIVATVVPPVVLCIGILLGVRQGYWLPTVQMYQHAASVLHAGAAKGCHSYQPLSDESAKNCTWNDTFGGRPLYLVGDSNADHLSEAVIGAGEALGRPVIISTNPSCPLLNGYMETSLNPKHAALCRSDVQGTLNYLETGLPGVVVLSASNLYWKDETWTFTIDGLRAEQEPRIHLFDQSLTSTVNVLQKAGHDVLLVHTVPRWVPGTEFQPERCALVDMVTTSNSGRCGRETALEAATTDQAETREVMQEVALETGADLVDPGPAMCPDGVCSVSSAGLIRMRDRTHISVAQSEALTPLFLDALRHA